MMVELGGGTNPHPRADIVIDLHHPKNAPNQDASISHWCYEEHRGKYSRILDSTADEVYASHFIEHVPKGPHLILVMNEAWRVLKSGGTLTLIMPIVGYTDVVGQPHVVASYQPWADPTHVGAWWLPEGLRYFTGEIGVEADYGIRQWGPLGGWITWAEADSILATDLELQTGPWRSWWSVRAGWEGVARLVKP